MPKLKTPPSTFTITGPMEVANLTTGNKESIVRKSGKNFKDNHFGDPVQPAAFPGDHLDGQRGTQVAPGWHVH